MASLNISIVQKNFIVGAIENNLTKIIDTYKHITSISKTDIVVFSELCITGYPAEDLYLQKNFQKQAALALEKLILITRGNSCALIVSNIENHSNVGYVIYDGKIIHKSIKRHLPNFDVFDEKRYFSTGKATEIFKIQNHKIGLMICEDIWNYEDSQEIFDLGAEKIIVINASPFTPIKDYQRKKIAKEICIKNGVDLFYINQVGGQDELVFDGGSFAYNKAGKLIAQLEYFKEDQISISSNQVLKTKNIPNEIESLYGALILGLYDYVNKNYFDKVLLGLSGGIDSALVAAIAVDALGADKVLAVMLPSKYTSDFSKLDALNLANYLGIKLIDIPIEETTNAARNSLAKTIEIGSLTDQNIQARTRGLLLMGLSNQLGYLLLSTGNKSENAVGYATIYGDMCGGYNPIKDVYKTQVYKLAAYRKLPESIINKAPSAELCLDQKDQDNLPEYEVLDSILFALIEEDLSINEVVSKGYDEGLVKNIFNMLKRAEYKRNQSCPGPIISIKSLGKGRRYPLTNHFVPL